MLQALANAGMKLNGFYTYKVCAPARASFLTGRFPFHLAATKTNFAYFWTLEGTNLGYLPPPPAPPPCRVRTDRGAHQAHRMRLG